VSAFAAQLQALPARGGPDFGESVSSSDSLIRHGQTRSIPLPDLFDGESPELGRMTVRRTLLGLLLSGLAVLIAVGVTQLPSGSSSDGKAVTRLTATQTSALLAGSPGPLAGLHAQAGMLLEGGSPALHARLAALKKYPVVINKWASWCVPCQEESAAFQRVSAEYGRRVAFIGIDSEDAHRADGAAFLKSFPVSYPSYYDKSGALGLQLTDSSFRPVTVFIPAHGSAYIREGEYPSAAKLKRDVQRYALDG
jgi:cytochrome c biogenesis protein CcmG, thiol:disulfide interchange protein DsbE